MAFEFEPREKKGKAKDGRQGRAARAGAEGGFHGPDAVGQMSDVRQEGVRRAGELSSARQSQVDAKPCKFKVEKTILEQPIDREQVPRLLAKGKTDLFEQVHFLQDRPAVRRLSGDG